MRDRLSEILPQVESKYGKPCEQKQITTIQKVLPSLLDGFEDTGRFISLDDGLELRLEPYAINKNDTAYAISYAYEDPVMGSMVSMYLLKDYRAGRNLELMTFSEGNEYVHLARALENEDLSDTVRELVWGRMEEIRRDQVTEMIHDSGSQNFGASYIDATNLIALIQEAQQADSYNSQQDEAEGGW